MNSQPPNVALYSLPELRCPYLTENAAWPAVADSLYKRVHPADSCNAHRAERFHWIPACSTGFAVCLSMLSARFQTIAVTKGSWKNQSSRHLSHTRLLHLGAYYR